MVSLTLLPQNATMAVTSDRGARMHDGGGGHGGCVGASAPVLVYQLFHSDLISGLTMGAEK
jgi:hypothetical protein